jgi:hypothetical protein
MKSIIESLEKVEPYVGMIRYGRMTGWSYIVTEVKERVVHYKWTERTIIRYGVKNKQDFITTYLTHPPIEKHEINSIIIR